MGKILFSKMFVGSYNEDNIGHEVINFFQPDNCDDSFLYIPPYGDVSSALYKETKHVVLLEKARHHAYHVKAIALNVVPLSDEAERKALENKICYGKVPAKDIKFDSGDVIFPIKQNLTFKVEKGNLYKPAEGKSYYVVPKPDNRFSEKEREDVVKEIENGGGVVLEVEVNPQRGRPTSCDCSVIDLDKFIKDKKWVEYPIDTVPAVSKSGYKDENVLSFIGKANDETVFSNMIKNILNSDRSLIKDFVEMLTGKTYPCSGSDFEVESEVLSLTESQKLVKQFFGRGNDNLKEAARMRLRDDYGIDVEQYEQNPYANQNGRIDLLIKSEKVIITVENKIKSSLNGIYEENNEIETQLTKYKNYIDSFKKENAGYKYADVKYYIFAPVYNCDFDVSGTCWKVVTYKELLEFFKKHKVNNAFYDVFINGLEKHSLTKEEEITRRFINALKR